LSFANLNASFSDLRDGLWAQVGRTAISELNIRPPAGEADEASFLRLTAWCYALLFEAGRIAIPFLLKLDYPRATKVDGKRHLETLAMVRCLRTSLFHNLGFEATHDLGVRRAVSSWFLDTCEATSPNSDTQWQSCFQRLSKDVRAILQHCAAALSAAAASRDDRDIVFDDLRRRLERDWEPYRFDMIVSDAAARLGEKINAGAFRERRLGDWRLFLSALPEDADPEHEIERLIDAEVANHFHSALPVRTRELMDVLELGPGVEVKRAIELARRIFESGVRDREELLAKVRAEFV
jgi:hypothetical protein